MTSWFLSTLNSWLLLLGSVILVGGIALLYLAWRQPERHWPLVSLGWVALLLTHWPLGLALGFDRGWAVASILPGFIALLWIGMVTPWKAWNPSPRKRSTRSNETSNKDKPASSLPDKPQVTLRHRANQTGQLFAQVLVVGILSFAAALGLGLALFSLLDTSIANRTIYSALLIILLWPILMVWSKAAASLIKPAIYFIGITIGGLLFTPNFF